MKSIKQAAIFCALLLASCKNDAGDIKILAEKFVTFCELKNVAAGNNSFYAVNYNIPENNNNEVEVSVNLKDTSSHAVKRGETEGILYLKIKKFEGKGWAVYSVDLKNGEYITKPPTWNNLPVPFTAENLDLLIKQADSAKIIKDESAQKQ
ncbi:hypothetical protein CJD36_012490 [Flavipsychrobacter stenotrophus]|uniref:Lipoprotein n=1 Tax=Flavipsychrobacter stenotrophus TaxID=2077091 RepID=A0A2S7SVY9_9BACT|nr:hypothetical protein [Flavipsychrobacter stenotrophus]PQJ10781.1 hypothetical protein CJD36_012490 [Flavipsychrobacter stenotrophus]